MALKKSQLYSSLWQSCDELRGGMDASQYKDYILTLLFVKYVSDKYKADSNALIEVPEGGSFTDMVRLKGDKEIGDKINKIIARLAEANDLEKLCEQDLLREFHEYMVLASNQRRLKVFRLEAVRAGFRKAWKERDYTTISTVARRIPDNFLQEDRNCLCGTIRQ